MHASHRDILLIFGQGGILLACALLMVAALMRTPRQGPWQMFVLALPILAGCIGAYLAAGVGSAIALLLAASVCAMLFCNGSCMFLATAKDGDPPPAGATATLIFPVGLVLLLSGFATHSTTAGLVGLAIIGILAMDMTRGDTVETSIAAPSTSASPLKWLLSTVVALLLAAVLCFSTISLLRSAHAALPLIRGDAFLVVLVCPAVTLPLLMRSMQAATRSNLAAATGLNSSVACLLLGIALPAFILVDYGIAKYHSEYARMAGLPPISWRLDSALLIMAGFAMLGMRVGLLRPERWVALLLMLIYGLYIMTGTLLRIG